MRIEIDASDPILQRYGNALGALGARGNVALARALNHTGGKAKTQVIRALTAQIGLPRKTIVQAIKIRRADQGAGGVGATLSYSLTSRGGDISLKYFNPREIGGGVRAKVAGEFKRYPGAFLRVGWGSGRRATDRFGGSVMRRLGAEKTPLEKVRSGVTIPEQMVTGATAEAWNSVVRSSLVPRVGHELARMLPR